ncbi:hypothetical protein [Aurantivibrio plasticivorans]
MSHSMELDGRQQFNQSRRWSEKLPSILRGFGAAAVIFSLYSFLFKGWEGSGDLARYLILLGHTGLLAVLALFAGHFLKEGKSPRVLLMLSLASVPVNFAVLGASVYAANALTISSGYPSYFAWSVGDWSTVIPLVSSALLVLMAVIFIGFQTLVRGMSKPMMGLFALSNLALVLPIRDPVSVTALATGLGLLTFIISTNTARRRTEARTFEGAIALLLQFVPPSIMLVRNVWVYQPDALAVLGLVIVCFIAIRHFTGIMNRDSFARVFLEILSVVFAFAAGVLCAITLVEWWYFSTFSIILFLSSLVMAGMLYELAQRAGLGGTVYRILAVVSFVGFQLLNVLAQIDSLSLLCGLMGGGLLLGVGSYAKQQSLLIGGSLLIVVALIVETVLALRSFDLNYWVTLTATGVVAIVLASLMESKAIGIKRYIGLYKNRFKEWEI